MPHLVVLPVMLGDVEHGAEPRLAADEEDRHTPNLSHTNRSHSVKHEPELQTIRDREWPPVVGRLWEGTNQATVATHPDQVEQLF